LAFGLAALAVLLLGEKLLPGLPVALVVVVISIIVLSVTPLGDLGFNVVGALPQGLPDFHAPGLRVRDVDGVIPLAFACLLLAYVESVSAARTLAQANGYEIDPRQELLGLGAANLAAAFCQAYPVAGGLSQSSVNDKAGAKTPLALVWASVTIGLCLMYLTGLLSNLPNVVLAAIVLVAVKGLINIGELRHVWRVSRFEFSVTMVAFAGVLLLGILNGVMVAVVVSILLLIRRAAHPHVAFLGRIPGTRIYSDIERHPDNEAVPGALVFRVEASLLYFNVEHVRAAVWQKIRSSTGAPKYVVCDLSSSPIVDLAGARMLATLYATLEAMGIRLRLVAAHATVRDILRAEGLEELVGYFGRRVSVADAIDELQGGTGAGAPAAQVAPAK
jgi:MFS superfamily sulfate permease-like transporter